MARIIINNFLLLLFFFLFSSPIHGQTLSLHFYNGKLYYSDEENIGLRISEDGYSLTGGQNDNTPVPEFKWDGTRRTLNVRNLQVGDKGDPPDIHIIRYGSSNGERYSGDIMAVVRGESLGQIYWDGGGGPQGSIIDRNAAGIYVKAMSTFTRDSSPGALHFATTSPNTVTSTSRVFITQYGGLILRPNSENTCSNVQSEMNSNHYGFCVEENKLYAIAYNKKILLLDNSTP